MCLPGAGNNTKLSDYGFLLKYMVMNCNYNYLQSMKTE